MTEPEKKEKERKDYGSTCNLNCRMYENQYPEQDTCVMVNVKQVTDVGTYVTLLEYNNIEGMILLSELTRRRVRSIARLVRVGKTEVAVVIRVDKDKGYIDLSKRRANAEEVKACEEKFQKSKAVHSIMRHVADKMNVDLEKLYVNFGWPLYKKYGHAFDAFKLVMVDPDRIFQDFELDSKIKQELIVNIKKRLTPTAIKLRSDIECSCFAYEGIDAVKKALLAGQKCSIDGVELKIRMIAPPSYVMESQCVDKALGIATMEKAIQEIERVVTEQGGTCVVKMKPKAVSLNEEQELLAMMEKAERENAMEDGDEEFD